MANLQFSKANRTKVIKSFPTKEMGKEGDIVISGIPGKGYYLCAKVGNRWYAADKLNELKRLKTPRLQDLQVDSLKVKNLKIEKKATGGEISVSKGNLILDVEGNLNFYNSGSPSVDILQSASYSGQINLYERKPTTGTQHYIGLKASSVMADSTLYTLPDAFPSSSSKLLQSTTAGVLSWVTDARLTLNNATENELVTVGSTTTELDAEANLTFDGTDLAIASTGKLYFGAGSHTYIHESGDDILKFVVGGTEMLVLEESTLDGVHVNNSHLTVDATKRIVLDGSTVGNTYISETSSDVLGLTVGGSLMMKLTEDTTNKVEIQLADLEINSGKKFLLDGNTGEHTYISESADDILAFYVGGDKMLSLDETVDTGVTSLIGTLKIAEQANASADTAGYGQIWVDNLTPNVLMFTNDIGTDYVIGPSPGTILGCTIVGCDVADDSYALTTSYVCFDHSGGTPIRVSFITPPSENVEIEVELYYTAGSAASDLELTLSNNSAYGSNTLSHPDQFSKSVREPARGHSGTVTQKWWIQSGNLSAIGSINHIYIAASTDSTSGTPTIRWGGDASGEYANLVFKATALPAIIAVGS